jgi:hypothetical protein
LIATRYLFRIIVLRCIGVDAFVQNMGSNRFQPTPTKANGHNFGHSKEPGIGIDHNRSSSGKAGLATFPKFGWSFDTDNAVAGVLESV